MASILTSAPPRSGSRRRAVRKPLLVVHIVSSVGLLGAVASSLLIALAATADPALADSAYDLIALQSAVFGISLSFIALGTGIALGRVTKWGVVTYRWTTAKLVLQVLIIVNGALVIGPAVSSRQSGGGSSDLLVGAEALTLALLLAAVVLTVFKPGGRRSPNRR